MAGIDDAAGDTRAARRLSFPGLAGMWRRRARRRPREDVAATPAGARRATDARAAALAMAGALPALAAGVAAAVPVLGSTIRAANDGWMPAGDDGIIATRGWDVLTAHTPLVGQYSEAGLVVHGQVMHSPGPMLYWLISLPARFGSVTSIEVTMGIVNTLAIVGCVILARRRGGLVLMLASALGIALMCRSLPAEAFHDIWNPAAGLFPFLLLIFVTWSIACGDHRLLVLAAIDASFVVQTHLMYAAPAAVLLAIGGGGLVLGWLDRRRRRRRRQPGAHDDPPPHRRVWPWGVAAAVVALACWTAPFADQLEHNPVYLAMIARNVGNRGPEVGSSIGWNAVVRSIGVRPWWLGAPRNEWKRKYEVGALPLANGTTERPSAGELASAIAILAALAAVGLLAVFALRFDLAVAALIGLGLCLALGVQVAANPATPLLAGTLGYTLWWGSQLGLWVWLVLGWALWLALSGALAHRLRRALRRRGFAGGRSPGVRGRALASALACAGAIGAIAGVGAAVAAAEQPDSHHRLYAPIAAVGAGLDRALPTGRTVELLVGQLDQGTQPMEPAIRFLLVRHDDRVLAPGSFPRLGAYYELYHRPVQWILLLTDGARVRPHWRLAARVRFTSGFRVETLSAWLRPANAAERRR